MAQVASPEQTTIISTAMVAFLACCGYYLYAFVRVMQNREPGHHRWERVPLSGETLTETGRKYLKRSYAAMVLGAAIVLLAIALTN